jgi:hypothetical protein
MSNGRDPKHSDIGEIIARFKEMFADGEVEQLQVKFATDDDGLWFFSRRSKSHGVQVEASFGKCPFLIEGDSRRFEAHTINEAMRILASLLGHDSP